MSQNLTINFSVGAFPIGFKGNCQDYANALVDRLTGTLALGTDIFSAQYGGPQPSTDIGPWWQNGTDLYVFDYSTGQYQPMEDQTPIGACILWAGSGAPARYLLCQGQNISRTQYSRLFQRIGTAWGAGDGANTFGLPACGKYIMTAGYDNISGSTFYNGTTGGSNQGKLSWWNLPDLSVTLWGIPSAGGNGAWETTSGMANTPYATMPVFSEGNSLQGHTAQPFNIQPPYQTMNLCIRYI